MKNNSRSHNLRTLVFLLAGASVLTACGGGGGGDGGVSSSNPPPASTPAAATGTVAAGVQILSDAENAQFVSRSGDVVTYVGPINLVPGTVVIGQNVAFKVTSARIEGGNTIVQVSEPAIEDVFETLKISGTYEGVAEAEPEGLPGQQAASAGFKIAKAQATTSYAFRWPTEIPLGSSKVSSTLEGTVKAIVDYDFELASGGLKTARLDIDASTALTAALDLKASGTVGLFEKKVGHYKIDIPVSLVDRALRVFGVRTISINIPFIVGAEALPTFDLNYSSMTRINGALSMIYDKTSGTRVTENFTATTDAANFFPTTPGGAPVLATFSSHGRLFFKMRPALAFVNSVALAGIDAKLGAGSASVLQVIPETPGFCLKTTPTVELEAFGFFKTVGLKELTSSPVAQELYKGATKELGLCKARAIVDLISTPPQTGEYGKALTLQTTVSLDPTATFSIPDRAPSGSVEIKLGGASCTAALVSKSAVTATGFCSLVPLVAGAAVPVTLTYTGDSKYSPTLGTGSLAVIVASRQYRAMYTVRSVEVGTPITDLCGTVRCDLYCQTGFRIGEVSVETDTWAWTNDGTASMKGTDGVFAGTFNSQTSFLDVSKIVAAHDVTPPNSSIRYYGSEQDRLRASWSPTDGAIRGTFIDIITSSWSRDSRTVQCKTTIDYVAIPLPGP